MKIVYLITPLLLGSALLARAGIITSARTINYQVTFSDRATFADAFATVTNTETIAPGSFGIDTEEGGYAALNTGLTFFASGGVSVSPLSAPAGTSDLTTTINVTGAGTYGFVEPVPVYNGHLSAVTYFPSPLARFPYNGFYTLELLSPSNGLLDPGGTWTTAFSLPGDWSAAGNADATGTHLLYDLDPLWTVTSDFVYDSATNTTLFAVTNTDYPGVDSYDNGPYPVVLLTGAPVPEPGAATLLGLGGLLTALALVIKERAKLRPSSKEKSMHLLRLLSFLVIALLLPPLANATLLTFEAPLQPGPLPIPYENTLRKPDFQFIPVQWSGNRKHVWFSGSVERNCQRIPGLA